ncbi:CLUMA_CG011541, isoform B [Clunio marinus]|nr:CLUMA_CG011541, isoform B [Clunio marinus]
MIYETCRSRMKYLKDLCNNINSETRNDHKLDYIELQLFEVGSKTNRNLYEWLQKNTINIKTSEMVINHRKRRRALMEAENAVSASQRSQS